MVVGHRPRETSPVPSTTFPTSRPPYAGEFFGAALPGSSHLPWPSLRMTSSALPCPPFGANISTLQGSLYVTGCWFAPPSRRDTALQHHRSPDSTGCLLRGPLVVTPGLSLSKSRPDLHQLAVGGLRTHQAVVRRHLLIRLLSALLILFLHQ